MDGPEKFDEAGAGYVVLSSRAVGMFFSAAVTFGAGVYGIGQKVLLPSEANGQRDSFATLEALARNTAEQVNLLRRDLEAGKGVGRTKEESREAWARQREIDAVQDRNLKILEKELERVRRNNDG